MAAYFLLCVSLLFSCKLHGMMEDDPFIYATSAVREFDGNTTYYRMQKKEFPILKTMTPNELCKFLAQEYRCTSKDISVLVNLWGNSAIRRTLETSPKDLEAVAQKTFGPALKHHHDALFSLPPNTPLAPFKTMLESNLIVIYIDRSEKEEKLPPAKKTEFTGVAYHDDKSVTFSDGSHATFRDLWKRK